MCVCVCVCVCACVRATATMHRCGPHWVRSVEQNSTVPSGVMSIAVNAVSAAANAATAGAVGGAVFGGSGTAAAAAGAAAAGAATCSLVPSNFNWEIRLPLYDPAVQLSVAVIEIQNSVRCVPKAYHCSSPAFLFLRISCRVGGRAISCMADTLIARSTCHVLPLC